MHLQEEQTRGEEEEIEQISLGDRWVLPGCRRGRGFFIQTKRKRIWRKRMCAQGTNTNMCEHGRTHRKEEIIYT